MITKHATASDRDPQQRARPLTASDRSVLIGLLDSLAARSAAARSASAVLVTRWLQQRGLRWADIIPPAPEDWRAVAQAAAGRDDVLTDWEIEFAGRLARFPNCSAKQRKILNQISEKLTLADGTAALP